MKTKNVGKINNQKLIECPLCEGTGKIDIERLGIETKTKKLAIMTAEETVQRIDITNLRSIQKIKEEVEKSVKTEFETKEEIMKNNHETDIKEKDREIDSQQDKIKELEGELTQLKTKISENVSIKGSLEEKEFIEEALICYPHFKWSDKLTEYGDYTALVPLKKGNDYLNTGTFVLFDVKSGNITKTDIDKIIRDAKFRKISYVFLIAKSNKNLRNQDIRDPVKIIDNILLVIGNRERGDWRSKLDVLKPYIERDYINQKTRLERGQWQNKTTQVLKKIAELSDIIQKCNKIEDCAKKIKNESSEIRLLVDDFTTEVEKILKD